MRSFTPALWRLWAWLGFLFRQDNSHVSTQKVRKKYEMSTYSVIENKKIMFLRERTVLKKNGSGKGT